MSSLYSPVRPGRHRRHGGVRLPADRTRRVGHTAAAGVRNGRCDCGKYGAHRHDDGSFHDRTPGRRAVHYRQGLVVKPAQQDDPMTTRTRRSASLDLALVVAVGVFEVGAQLICHFGSDRGGLTEPIRVVAPLLGVVMVAVRFVLESGRTA